MPPKACLRLPHLQVPQVRPPTLVNQQTTSTTNSIGVSVQAPETTHTTTVTAPTKTVTAPPQTVTSPTETQPAATDTTTTPAGPAAP